MASAGPSASSASNEALISAPFASAARPPRIAPRPSFGLRPAAARSAPYAAKVFGKNARTAWPKMIGSETFIMVAFRCTEKSTPSDLARAICAVRNARSAATCITEASTTSPASTFRPGLSRVTAPSAATCSMRRTASAARVAERSVLRKSSTPMVATEVLDPPSQAPMRCGWVLA